MSVQEVLVKTIKEAQKIAILPHVSPDGDAMGSCFALKELLGGMGKQAEVIAEGKVPENLDFLGNDWKAFSQEEENNCDLVFAVDCGAPDRIGKREALFKSAAKTVNIDHHETNDGFGDINVVKSDAAATAEIVFDLFSPIVGEIKGRAAMCLLAAIISDTGGFRYSNTTVHTHNIAAKLMENGADSAKICSQLFERKRISQLRIEGVAINEAHFYHDGKTVISVLTKQMIEDAGAEDGDTDAISSTLRSIDGVSAAVLLREKDDIIKISMRTGNEVNASEVCALFGGGGHSRAAGASTSGDIYGVAEKIAAEIEKSYGI